MATLIKVIFEYSDGTKKYLVNQDLERWEMFNSLVASCAQNHNLNPDWGSIKWKEIGKDILY